METQNIAYKELWRDDYLKWICGFANAQGGRLYIGLNDDGLVIGLNDCDKLLEDIPNKVASSLGLVVDVNLKVQDGLQYLEIIVPPSNIPISYHGIYHYRSGATKQELNGISLQWFLEHKLNYSWDDIPNENADMEDIDKDAIDYFLNNSIRAGRISDNAMSKDVKCILENLNLLDKSGHLKNAALLLFGKNSLRFFPMSDFRIGRFGLTDSDLIIQDIVEGDIIRMADRVIDILRSKYLVSPIKYQGLQRLELLEMPEGALREAIFNAIIHKDYTGAHIQMKVYDDRIEIWNQGKLPDNWTIDNLLASHPSQPRNRNIAQVFYKAGFIES